MLVCVIININTQQHNCKQIVSNKNKGLAEKIIL